MIDNIKINFLEYVYDIMANIIKNYRFDLLKTVLKLILITIYSWLLLIGDYDASYWIWCL